MINNPKFLKNKFFDYIFIQKINDFYEVRDFGAILFAEQLGCELKSDKISRFKVEIPVKFTNKIINMLNESNYKYIIIEQNEILELHSNGTAIPQAEPKESSNKKLEEVIKQYRYKKASELHIPPYCIFDNKTLKSLVENLPTSQEELKFVYGFGKSRTEKYGQDIIDIICKYTNQNPNANSIQYKSSNETTNSLIPKQEKQEDTTLANIMHLVKLGHNVFLTGHAGTGKSYILEKLKEQFKKLVITSTTGLAAVNVKGQTIHSWAGVGICKKPIKATVQSILTEKTNIKRQIQRCKLLAIDEISMLNIKTFEYIDKVLREVRECDKPFGGIQVIFIGDFFQLPPVEEDGNLENLYSFESPIWKEFNFKNILLTKNYRQNEKDFINALSNMRMNCLTQEDINLLKTRTVEEENINKNILHIFSTNEEANLYNRKSFEALHTILQNFESKDGVWRKKNIEYSDFTQKEQIILDIFNKNCRAEKTIHLKLGCRVMLLTNLNFAQGLINGSCGTVKAFNEKSITVEFDNGITRDINPEKFEYYYNNEPKAIRMQYPLRLAYAITIHKSQGMTLDSLFVDCKRIFEKGQAYVAMSRVKTLSGLYLCNFSKDRVYTDEKVADFYKNLDIYKPDKYLK